MMETWTLLLGGFGTALQPMNLMWAFIGCLLGTAIGTCMDTEFRAELLAGVQAAVEV